MMHREFWGCESDRRRSERKIPFFGGMDTDTALIISVILLLKNQGGHDMLLPALLYILM